jgi:hypothetical protein
MAEDETVGDVGEETEASEGSKGKADRAATPRKTVAVRVVAEKGGADSESPSALVEWLEGDDLRRCYVPATEIQGGKASKEALAAGIPYGVPWEDRLGDLPKALARKLGAELRRRGVWEKSDLNDVKAVRAAIGATLGNIFTLLRKAAEEVEHAD